MILHSLASLVLLAAASSVALAQGGQRAMTRHDFAACEEFFSNWQWAEVEATLSRLDSLKGERKQEAIDQAERYLAAGRSKGPLDFWWEHNATDVADAVSADLAGTEQRLRREKELNKSLPAGTSQASLYRNVAVICMHEVRAEFLRTGKVRAPATRRSLTRTEIAPCMPYFIRYQEAELSRLPEEIAASKAGPPRGRLFLGGMEQKLEAAKSKGPLDFWWENHGHNNYMAGVVSMDAVRTEKQLRHERELAAATKAGDKQKMLKLYAYVPTGKGLVTNLAAAEGSVCVLELRKEFLRTGKVPATR